MPVITKEMTINDVVQKHPGTMKVFNQYNLDSCCGGAQSIGEAAAAAGADLEKVLEDLNAAAGEEKQNA
ncbi:MAG: DUF542 domain-containing protein [Candidatus Nitrospinota bacterium M3_3B_026]